jgi:hypothetical protein
LLAVWYQIRKSQASSTRGRCSCFIYKQLIFSIKDRCAKKYLFNFLFFYELSGFDQHPKQKIGKHNDSYGLSCSNYSKTEQKQCTFVYRNIHGTPLTLQNVIEWKIPKYTSCTYRIPIHFTFSNRRICG